MEASEAAAAGGGVRVVAMICAPAAADPAAPTPTKAAAANSFKVAATRGGGHPRAPDAAALLSFTAAATPPSSSSSQGRGPSTRKEEHRLDWCYLQDENSHHVFVNEVRPLIHRLLDGTASCNACVVACGAAAAKDRLLAGSQEQPGLVRMAMEQILQFSETIGGAVMVSSYQVLQDTNVFDLLEPKDQEVTVLEDSQGNTHLKGLSKVRVKSIEDFTQLSCFNSNQNKHPTKASTLLQTRGHQGLIIHISSFDQDGKERAVAKMNFLNLTGYVDPKQRSNGRVAALSNSNKSMYALMNVVKVLNSNQSFVPYRQSKVTRILQDSLCKTSAAVLIACLDEISCQDTVSTLSLAARSSQVANDQLHRYMSVTSSKRLNVNLSENSKNSSRPLLTSVRQPNPILKKHDQPQWNNSAAKTCRTPIANKSRPIMQSGKKSESLLSTPIKMKQRDAKPTMSGRSQPIVRSTKNPLSDSIKMKQKDAKSTVSGSTLLCPSTNSSKEVQPSQGIEIHALSTDEGFDKTSDTLDIVSSETQKVVSSSMDEEEDVIVVAPVAVKVKEVQSSRGIEIQAPSTDEGFDEASDTLDAVSFKSLKVVSSSTEEEDYSSSGLYAASSCTDLSETCSSNVSDVLVEKTPVNASKQSPKLTDRLREISNSLKLLNARPLSIMTPKVGMETPHKAGMETPQKAGVETPQKAGMEYVQPIIRDVPEPKTPVMHLKYEPGEDPCNSFKARSTGIKKSLVQECLTFLNSANKEELKSLKGIGEKRANYIIELRENSPELFKKMDDLRDILRMDKKEIKRMMSGIIDS